MSLVLDLVGIPRERKEAGAFVKQNQGPAEIGRRTRLSLVTQAYFLHIVPVAQLPFKN